MISWFVDYEFHTPTHLIWNSMYFSLVLVKNCWSAIISKFFTEPLQKMRNHNTTLEQFQWCLAKEMEHLARLPRVLTALLNCLVFREGMMFCPVCGHWMVQSRNQTETKCRASLSSKDISIWQPLVSLLVFLNYFVIGALLSAIVAHQSFGSNNLFVCGFAGFPRRCSNMVWIRRFSGFPHICTRTHTHTLEIKYVLQCSSASKVLVRVGGHLRNVVHTRMWWSCTSAGMFYLIMKQKLHGWP